MVADASIYGQIRPYTMEDPISQTAKALQVRHLIDSGELNDLQRRKLTSDLQEEEDVKAAFAGIQPGQSVKDILPGVYKASPKTGVSMQKSIADQEKSAAELEKTKLETKVIQAKQLRDKLAAVTDDAGLAQVRQDAIALSGPQAVADMPQSVNDPAFNDWKTKKLLTADEMFKQFEAQKGRDLTTRGQDLTASSSAEGHRLTARGQDLADARARDTAARSGQHYDADRGVIVNTQDGTTTPVTGADGKPIGAKPLLPQQAAQAQMLIQGRQDVARARGLLFEKDGSVNRTNLMNSQTWGVPGISALQTDGTPFTQGRDLRSYILNAVEGKLRLESGAAVPEQEVKRIAQRFVPTAADNDATIKQKIDRLDEYMAGSLSLTKLPAGAQSTTPTTNLSRSSKGKIKFLGFEE